MSIRELRYRLLASVVVLCLGLMSVSDLVSAADEPDLAEMEEIGPQIGVSTLNLNLSAVPGEILTGAIEVHNLGTEPEGVQVLLADWEYDPSGAVSIHEHGTVDRSLAGMLTVAPASMMLSPGETRPIQYRIEVPPDSVGSFWAMIMVRSEPKVISSSDFGEGRTAVFAASKTYGIKLIVTAHSESEKELVIEDSAVEYLEACEGSVLEIRSLVTNTGLAHLELTGTVNLINEHGDSVGAARIGRARVLPGYQRLVRTTLAGQLDPGFYVAVVVLDFGGDYLVGSQVEFEIGE